VYAPSSARQIITFREAEIARSHRALRSHHKQAKRKRSKYREKGRRVAAALFSNNDDRVLSFKAWCLL
jgi:hypothetical protein